MFKSPFTASRWQVSTYLLGVALFSISFLVFLNSSVSFVVTDLIGRKTRVGDAVGTLGFADELVALVACPFWGLLSDRVGVRTVCVLGYGIVGLSLFIFVQASNVYPQLLLARLFFSVGGAATSTMVTAVLPTMTMKDRRDETQSPGEHGPFRSNHITSVISDSAEERSQSPESHVKLSLSDSAANSRSATSQVAGFVGMFTGLGALIALTVFLPLPARFQKSGNTPAEAVTHSFYVVGAIAFVVSGACALGLRNLPGETGKSWRSVIGKGKREASRTTLSYPKLLLEAAKLGLQDQNIGLGYLGGFVARASSVGITLFIPLFVNAYFISSGRCTGEPNSNPEDIKDQCRRAYVVASILSGVSQLIALVCAPIFGYLDGRYARLNAPLLIAALSGVIGYIAFAQIQNPDPGSKGGSPAVFAVMGLVGISQIGAIVCSLSLLSRGVQSTDAAVAVAVRGSGDESVEREASPLLAPSSGDSDLAKSRSHLKGSIAGLYSLAGGAGILLLTKLGGVLFDNLSSGAPFYMLAAFNAVLLLVGVAVTTRSRMMHRAWDF